jgi:membrane protein implicated in regulation of membrane protease activity
MASESTRAQHRKLAQTSLRYALLLGGSALCLLVPIVLVPHLAELQFLPAVFVSEYSKLLGSSLVSVAIAWAWKRYDRARHRQHATREKRLAHARLQHVTDRLQQMLELELPGGGGVTERGEFWSELNRTLESIQVIVDDVHASLRALSPDVREHLEVLCSVTSLYVDASRSLRAGSSHSHESLQKVKTSASRLLSTLASGA